jgi:hypothetical protein
MKLTSGVALVSRRLTVAWLGSLWLFKGSAARLLRVTERKTIFLSL